ncbi:MAG: GerMN domain-containing protein [Hungatella sp.]
MKTKRNRIGVIGMAVLLLLTACTPTTPKQEPGASGVMTPKIEETTKEVVEKGANPNEPVLDVVFLYFAHDDATGLVRTMEDVEVLDAQTAVDLLIQHGVLEEGTTALSFEIAGGEKAGPGVAADQAGKGERIGTLDLSQIPSFEAAKEPMMLAAIGNTFTESFELDQLKLLIGGKNYSSAHTQQGDEDYLFYEEKYQKVQ